MLSVIGIFLGLAILIISALKGWQTIIGGILASAVVILLSGANLFDTISNVYMSGFINWAGKFYLMLVAGSIFAKLMEDSGAAVSISRFIMKLTGRTNLKRIFIGLWFVTFLLLYAGINVWIIVFVMMPIIYPIFKELDLPWHIALAIFCLGANCSANWFPGAVTIYNIMPMEYLNTTALAGWKISIFSEGFAIAAGFWYIFRQLKKAQARGEHFVKPELLDVSETNQERIPNVFIAFAPVIVTLVLLNVFDIDVFFSLAAGCIACIALMFKNFDNLLETLNKGAVNSVLPVIDTCAVVGFGSVVASVPGYQTLTNAIINGIPGSPYISWCLSVNALAGITGSASGGLAIGLESLLPSYINLGLSPDALHRLAAIACGGLDSLPHNGAIITIITVFGLKYKEGYKHFFWISVVITVLSCIPAVIAALIFY